MAVVKALSFMSYNTVVLATQIHDTIFNTIHHCVTEDRHKSWELPFPCTPLAITHSLDHDFLPRDAMHSADYAVARCPSVCLSVRLFVTRRYSIETAKHIIKLFSPSGSHDILVLNRQIIIIIRWHAQR